MEVVGCKSAAAVHFLPSFCPIAGLWGCKSGKNCPRWGRFWRNLRFSLSTLQVRQPPSHISAHCVVANRLCSRAKRRALRLALHPKSGRQNAQLITLRALSPGSNGLPSRCPLLAGRAAVRRNPGAQSGWKLTFSPRPARCRRVLTFGLSASRRPLRYTLSRCARRRRASMGSRACSSTKLASQPASMPPTAPPLLFCIQRLSGFGQELPVTVRSSEGLGGTVPRWARCFDSFGTGVRSQLGAPVKQVKNAMGDRCEDERR